MKQRVVIINLVGLWSVILVMLWNWQHGQSGSVFLLAGSDGSPRIKMDVDPETDLAIIHFFRKDGVELARLGFDKELLLERGGTTFSLRMLAKDGKSTKAVVGVTSQDFGVFALPGEKNRSNLTLMGLSGVPTITFSDQMGMMRAEMGISGGNFDIKTFAKSAASGQVGKKAKGP